MRKYNYFDDDDELQEQQSGQLATAVKNGAAAALTALKGALAKGKEAAREKRAAKTDAPAQTAPPTEQPAVIAADSHELQPPKPSLGHEHLDELAGVTDVDRYEQPPVLEVTVPSLDSASLTVPKREPAPREQENAHTITEASVHFAEPETGEDAVSDAIRAFSHKSGDKVSVAKPVERIRRVAETVIESNPIETIERVSRGKRFLITLALLLFTVLFFVGVVFFFMRSITAENDRISEFNANAGEVCADYIMKYGSANYENLYNTYGVQGFRMTGLCFARELDFDGDGSSELMLCYLDNGEYYNDVWGYNSSGDFDMLFSEKTAQSEDKSQDAWATLYYKDGRYLIAVHDPEDIAQVKMYQLRNAKFSEKFACVYDSVTESYVVNDEPDLISFEHIKLSVLRAEKAIVSADEVMNTLDGFAGTESVIADPGTAQTMENAYYMIVQEYNKRYGTAAYVEKDGKAYLDGLAVVDLIDFDGDGQDELLLVYRKQIKERDENSEGESITKNVDKYYCDIYRYSGARALLAYSNEGLSNVAEPAADIYYILKKADGGYHYCINSVTLGNYGDELYASSGEMEYNGTEFTSYLNVSYEQQYGYSEYYVEGESVKKSVFEDTADGIPLFGENGDGYDKDTYLVTYVQRKTGDAGDMNRIPENTEKTIQKLNAQYEAN